MAIRNRLTSWPPWTRQGKATAPQKLTEPLRSTLRRIDEQFLAINRLVLDAYDTWPLLVSSGRSSLLEQDEPYFDGHDASLEQHEDIALLARLADFVCPEVWADFFADLNRVRHRGNDRQHRQASETLTSVARRRNVATELYGSIRDLLQERGLKNTSVGIELKVTLLANLLVISDASEAFVNSESVESASKSLTQIVAHYESLTAWAGTSRSQKSAVQRLGQNDVATLVAVTSGAVVLCMLAFVPAWPLYNKATRESGLTADMDFWCLVQNMGMQLLGIFTTVFPIRRLAFAAKGLTAQLWVHVFSTVGVLVTLCALPVYLYASVFWSSTLLFLGSAAQAFLVLQLALLAGTTLSEGSVKKE